MCACQDQAPDQQHAVWAWPLVAMQGWYHLCISLCGRRQRPRRDGLHFASFLSAALSCAWWRQSSAACAHANCLMWRLGSHFARPRLLARGMLACCRARVPLAADDYRVWCYCCHAEFMRLSAETSDIYIMPATNASATPAVHGRAVLIMFRRHPQRLRHRKRRLSRCRDRMRMS